MPRTSKRLPRYADDAAYLADEVRWVRAAAEHRIARRAQSEMVRRFPVTHPDAERESVRLSIFAWGQRWVDTRRSMVLLRQEIDHRLNTGRMGRKRVHLDEVQRALGLGDLERSVLLIAAAPLMQRELEPLFDTLARRESGGRVTPAVVFEVLALFDEPRIRARQAFAPDALLRAHALVALTVDPDHPDFLDSSIHLTSHGLRAVLGPMADAATHAPFDPNRATPQTRISA